MCYSLFVETVNIQERKLELIQWLSVVDDIAVLDKIADLKDQETQDWWDDISGIERESIEIGIEQADSGKVRPHSAVKRLYEKWL